MQDLDPHGEPNGPEEDSGIGEGKQPASGTEKRDRRAGVMLTHAEYERVVRLARRESRSISSAMRLLILDGLRLRSEEDT